MKLSIIIPAYNVENLLEKCVLSCIKQDIPQSDYEILIINDGSKDDTLAVAQRLAEEYTNIRVFTQENQGQSVARNVGIENAEGDYVWFVDSDDYVAENCVSSLLTRAYENDLDALAFDMYCIDECGNITEPLAQDIFCVDKTYSGRDVIFSSFNSGSVCARLYKHDMLIKNELRFLVGRAHQDTQFSYDVLPYIKSMQFIPDRFYFYYRHSGTTSLPSSKEKLIKYIADNGHIAAHFIQMADDLPDSIADKQLRDRIKAYGRSIIFGTVYSLWRNRKKYRANGVNAAVLAEFKRLGIYPIKPPYNNQKHAIMSRFILNHKQLFI